MTIKRLVFSLSATAILAVAAGSAAADECADGRPQLAASSLGSLMSVARRCDLDIDHDRLNEFVDRNIPECARPMLASPLTIVLGEGLDCRHAELSATALGIVVD